MITTASITGQELFVSRMFCPAIASEGEVMASGTGHCLVGPYWYRKCGVPAGDEIKATQVSSRGGDLKLVWLEDEGTMVLRGVSTVVARGELYV
jgi:predicted PhzF superfamily epimerase YddE/YHI9